MRHDAIDPDIYFAFFTALTAPAQKAAKQAIEKAIHFHDLSFQLEGLSHRVSLAVVQNFLQRLRSQ